MLLGDLAEVMGGRLLEGAESREIRSVVIDSRLAGPGSLFFALEGKRTDGHMYVQQVLDMGGSVVVSRGRDSVGSVLVHDVEQALQAAASWRREGMLSRVIGITGSSGKTTTRRLLVSALEEVFTVHATTGNLNNQLGLPLTILNTPEPEPDIVVLEMGMNHPGELTILGGIAMPTECLVTNIGTAHMEYFRSREGIAAAKAELIAETEMGGICVIPADEPILLNETEGRELNVRLNGPGGDGWVHRTPSGYALMPWDIHVELRLNGAHNYRNAVSALLMAEALDVPVAEAVKAMEGVEPLPGRGRRIVAGHITLLDESYNANPESTAACLETLADFDGEKGAVLGDMRELGPEAPRYHRDILAKADNSGLRFLILTGPVYASVSETVSSTPLFLAVDWEEALVMLRSSARPGDTVLVKGSNSVGLGELVKAMEED